MGIYYTNQTLEAFKLLQKQGYLNGNERFVYEDFISSYEWIVLQMNNRLKSNSSLPIWLWSYKPDLIQEGHFEKGTKAVCLTLEIPDEDILLSDFEAWHCVLNDSFLPLSEEEDYLYEHGEIEMTKKESWERIFDLEKLKTSELWGDHQVVVQGITPSVNVSQIVKVEYFIAK